MASYDALGDGAAIDGVGDGPLLGPTPPTLGKVGPTLMMSAAAMTAAARSSVEGPIEDRGRARASTIPRFRSMSGTMSSASRSSSLRSRRSTDTVVLPKELSEPL